MLLHVRHFTQAHEEKPAAEKDDADEKKLCTKCGRPVENSQTKGCCKACNCKRSLLSQMFGSWPIQPFLDLPEEAQKDFWLSDAKGKVGLQACLELKVSEFKAQVETKGIEGKYLPISVYQSLGYNTEKIQENCPCVFDEKLQERTYLLDVKIVENKTIKQNVREEIASLRDPSFRGRLSHYASPTKASPKKRTRSSSSSSSSSDAATKAKRAAAKAKAASKKEAAAAKALKAKEAKDKLKAATAERKAAAKQQKLEARSAAMQQKKEDSFLLHARVMLGRASGNWIACAIGTSCIEQAVTIARRACRFHMTPPPCPSDCDHRKTRRSWQ